MGSFVCGVFASNDTLFLLFIISYVQRNWRGLAWKWGVEKVDMESVTKTSRYTRAGAIKTTSQDNHPHLRPTFCRPRSKTGESGTHEMINLLILHSPREAASVFQTRASAVYPQHSTRRSHRATLPRSLKGTRFGTNFFLPRALADLYKRTRCI